MTDAFAIARSIQKHVKRVKSFGYSHPPIVEGEGAYFRINVDGHVFRVNVIPNDDYMTKPSEAVAYKLIKDGHVWDYSDHLCDVERWQEKVLREDPDADTQTIQCPYKELTDGMSA